MEAMENIFDTQKFIDFFLWFQIFDYVFLVISLLLWIFCVFLGFEKIIKSYIWVTFWLFLFSFISLSYMSIDKSMPDITWITKMLIENTSWFLTVFLILIPVFWIVFPFNSNFGFKAYKSQWLNAILSFIFWFLLPVFILSIMYSIINNRFMFKLNTDILSIIWEISMIKLIIWWFDTSAILLLLKDNEHILNLIIIIFIFQKITLWNFIWNLFSNTVKFIKNTFKNKPWASSSEKKE